MATDENTPQEPEERLLAEGRAPQAPRRSVALNTLIFSIATGLSRIAGLVREVVARGYFGTSGPASAFTLAFQVPNLVRSFVADAALSAAFVPVFTDLLEQDRRKDAVHLASTLLFALLAVLGAVTALFVLGAGVVMPLFVGGKFTPHLVDLTVGLSQVLFPIVLLLGINGLVVGILNAHDHFSVPAIAPLVWNVVIIFVLVVLHPAFEGDSRIYAYAIGVLLGTVVQLAMALPVLSRLGFRFAWRFDPRDPRVRRVLVLMLPVTLGLGIINVNLLITSGLGTLISEEASTGIDAAFRIYMLPQGIFSVAVATVLFPTLSRFASRGDVANVRATCASGVRQILLLLVPAAVWSAVLATPVTRLIYERGQFDASSTRLVAEALFWFAFSLPTSGINLLLTRTFFSLQRPWLPTALAVINLAVNAVASLLLYRRLGVAGLVIGTAAGSFAMAAGQYVVLRRVLGGSLEGRRTLDASVRIAAGSALLGITAYGAWWALDELLGRSLPAEIVAVGTATLVGSLAYAGAVTALRVPEAAQIRRLLARRLGRAAA